MIPCQGVIVFCRVMEGRVKKGHEIHMMATGFTTEVVEVGYFGAGQFIPCDELTAGMVGYITASIKNVRDTRVGDTVTDADNPCAEALPGYKKVNPMVYCGLYPADGAKYGDLVTRWRSFSSTMLPFIMNRRHRSPLALVSAAVSWDFFIWRSFRSVWRESITWIL